MKILIIGYGSVGRRHADVLTAPGNQIAFVSSGCGTLSKCFPTDKYKRYESLIDACINYKPDYIVDCTPSIFHLSNFMKCVHLGIPWLTEKPFLAKPLRGTEYEDLNVLLSNSKVPLSVGFQYRYHPLINKSKELLSSILTSSPAVRTSIRWTEYLPAWHKWEDYKLSYASSRKLGGGVLLTMCHPFDYIEYLHSAVVDIKVKKLPRKLGLEVDDGMICNIKTSDQEIQLYVDFASNYNCHDLNIDGRDWRLNLDLVKNVGRFCSVREKPYIFTGGAFERNDMFRCMHRDFQKSIKGMIPVPNSIEQHLQLAQKLAILGQR